VTGEISLGKGSRKTRRKLNRTRRVRRGGGGWCKRPYVGKRGENTSYLWMSGHPVLKGKGGGRRKEKKQSACVKKKHQIKQRKVGTTPEKVEKKKR